MLDRESTFAQPEIVQLLQSRFVPVAIDQACQRRQQDTEGDFYRKIASQSPRNDFQSTTQGFYIATAAGDLLLYNNNRDPQKLLRLMKEKLRDFDSLPDTADVAQIEPTRVDSRYSLTPPDGGLVLRVHTKILDGYEPTANRWKSIFQSSLSRDNLWISRAEHRALVGGQVPKSLQQRIARFHLVDNTRGEPPMWGPDEIVELSMTVDEGAVNGRVRLSNQRGDRGYDAEFKGKIEVKADQVVRLDMVCLGDFWGEGRYTRGAPEGKFPLAVSFTLADGTDIADGVPPQGARGWLQGYLREANRR